MEEGYPWKISVVEDEMMMQSVGCLNDVMTRAWCEGQ